MWQEAKALGYLAQTGCIPEMQPLLPSPYQGRNLPWIGFGFLLFFYTQRSLEYWLGGEWRQCRSPVSRRLGQAEAGARVALQVSPRRADRLPELALKLPTTSNKLRL